MAWDKGFNFRASSGYVTDGANETYVLATDSYPTTRNTVTFGWTVSPTDSRDRNNALDRRLAGINFGSGSGTFQVDLPAAGAYTIDLALGDAGNGQEGNKILVKDNTATLLTIGPHTTAAEEFYDATDTSRANAAAWVSNHATSLQTFSSTVLKVTLETAITNTTLAHLFLSQVATGITFDAASNSGEQLADDSYTWNHTCTGEDRYLTVGIGMLSLAQTVSSITYNSVAMTFLGAQSSVSGAARVELWGLIAPSTGSNAILVTLTGAINSGGVAASYTGVHQSSPTEAFNSAQATNVGAADATVTITTVVDNAMVVDVVATDDTAITVGAGQTQRNNIAGTVGSTADSDEPKATAGAVTMSWTNVAALATWSIAGVALRPVGSRSLNQANFFLMF